MYINRRVKFMIIYSMSMLSVCTTVDNLHWLSTLFGSFCTFLSLIEAHGSGKRHWIPLKQIEKYCILETQNPCADGSTNTKKNPTKCSKKEKQCHMSPVTCHLSPVTCHMSPATCHQCQQQAQPPLTPSPVQSSPIRGDRQATNRRTYRVNQPSGLQQSSIMRT